MFFLIWAIIFCVTTVYSSPFSHVKDMLNGLERNTERYTVPRLAYKYDAFEPWIDAKTMEAHHKQVAEERAFQLNRVLKDWRSTVSKSYYLMIMLLVEKCIVCNI